MQGAGPSQFSWTGEKLNRKPPAKRIFHETVHEVQELLVTETTDESTSSSLALACVNSMTLHLKLLKMKLTQSLS